MTLAAADTDPIEALLPVLGSLVYSNRRQLADAIDQALTAGATLITIDLTQCSNVDSSGLGALVLASRKARAANGRIRLLGLDDDLRETLRLTQVDTLFDWPESPAESSEVDRG